MSEPTQGETLLASMLQTEALTTAILLRRGERILDLMDEVQSLRLLLASLEWSHRWEGGQLCPICRMFKRNGHADGCALVAAIAGKGAA